MIKTLFIDDSSLARKLAKNSFADLCDMDFAPDLSGALELLISNKYSFFITDYQLGKSTGIELARIIRSMEDYLTTPIILLSASMSNEIAYSAMKAGINMSFSKLEPISIIKEWVKKLDQTPFIEEVVLEYIESTCLSWKKDNVYYEYSPELDITFSGYSEEKVYEKMSKAIMNRYIDCQEFKVISDDIKISHHRMKRTLIGS